VNITVPGIVVFTVLVVAFFAWAGGPPTMPDDYYMTRRALRFWFYCSLLFVAGAGTACFGDKQYGMFPPTSLRWLFIIFGVFIMAVSTVWIYSLVKARTSHGSNDKRGRVETPVKLSSSSNNPLPA